MTDAKNRELREVCKKLSSDIREYEQMADALSREGAEHALADVKHRIVALCRFRQWIKDSGLWL